MSGRVFIGMVALVLASTGAGGSARPDEADRSLALSAMGQVAARAHARIAAMIADGRLRVARVHHDSMIQGRVHERLAQRHAGLPVFGAEVVRQIENGQVHSVFGRTYEGIRVSTNARLSAVDASHLAVAVVGPAAAASESPTLGILPAGRTYELAWRVAVRGPRSIADIFVDAGTGVILGHRSRIRSQFEDIGIGRGVFGDEKKVVGRRGVNGFETHDPLRPGPTRTFDFVGSPTRLVAFLQTGILNPGDIGRDADNRWEDGAVVDAHVYTGFTYDYFFKRYARRGMDDANGLVNVVVHPLRREDADEYDPDDVDLFINNALYLGGRYLMFGDGDGRFLDYLAGGLDVVAHEWAHGVTEYGADLIYQDESGALNESFSDIIGTAVEFMFEEAGSGRQRADWLIGEDITKTGGPLRSMSDPASVGDPDHYSLRRFIGTDVDNGGIHINSGISNHAFYLAVNGGRNRISGLTVQGVGVDNIERMERIFYRAFVYFLTPNARFSDARAATLAAATELYGAGSNEFQQLQQAWTAVGVQ
jgi:bacillolysin